VESHPGNIPHYLTVLYRRDIGFPFRFVYLHVTRFSGMEKGVVPLVDSPPGNEVAKP
jgi:hypothetical protein